MKQLTDLLGGLATEFPDQIAGKSPASGFDGPPLPENRQYRAEIVRGEWRQSTGSGNWSFSFTFEVTEPAEFAGRKFSEYYDPNGHQASREKLSRLIGESGLNLDEVDKSDYDVFAKAFEGTSYVVATRIWGTENDRTGLRYLNKDRGQALQENIKPPVKKTPPADLQRPDISVLKAQQEAAAQAAGQTEESAPAPESAPQLPGAGVRPPVTLPPGLRRD